MALMQKPHPAVRNLLEPNSEDPRGYEDVEEGTQFANARDQAHYDAGMNAIGQQLEEDAFEDAFADIMTSGMPPHKGIGSMASMLVRRVMETGSGVGVAIDDQMLWHMGVGTIEKLGEMAFESGYLGNIDQESTEYQLILGASLEEALSQFGATGAANGEFDQEAFRQLFANLLEQEGLNASRVMAEIEESLGKDPQGQVPLPPDPPVMEPAVAPAGPAPAPMPQGPAPATAETPIMEPQL